LKCGSEVYLSKNNIYDNNNKVIVLTGTYASGKSSTAEILMDKHGFNVIDGDCVMQVVKHRLKVDKIEFNAPAMYEEIEKELDILVGFEKDIVISHVITPQDIDLYR
jgi:broad-specificity NMP kinase